MAAKKKTKKPGSGWTWRLAGIALCVFFALGVITGLSQSGRMLAHHIAALLDRLPHKSRSELIPAAYQALRLTLEGEAPRPAGLVTPPSEAIALVEHADGFYQLDSSGALHGPLSPVETPDLPILSGVGIENARSPQLVEYAAKLIRAEALLSQPISEMHVNDDAELILFLERPRLAIALTAGQLPLQLARAAQVLDLWRGHRELIGVIDMTTPGEAIVQPKSGPMQDRSVKTRSRRSAAKTLAWPAQS